MTRDDTFEPVEFDEYVPDEADFQETDASWWADYERERHKPMGPEDDYLYAGNEFTPDGIERYDAADEEEEL